MLTRRSCKCQIMDFPIKFIRVRGLHISCIHQANPFRKFAFQLNFFLTKIYQSTLPRPCSNFISPFTQIFFCNNTFPHSARLVLTESQPTYWTKKICHAIVQSPMSASIGRDRNITLLSKAQCQPALDEIKISRYYRVSPVSASSSIKAGGFRELILTAR